MTDGVLRIAQLNAGSLLEPGWDERRYEVAAWLERLDPDVVCLQEIWQSSTGPNTAGWLVDQAPPGRWHWTFGGGGVGPPFATDPTIMFGSAILSRWPSTTTTTGHCPSRRNPRRWSACCLGSWCTPRPEVSTSSRPTSLLRPTTVITAAPRS